VYAQKYILSFSLLFLYKISFFTRSKYIYNMNDSDKPYDTPTNRDTAAQEEVGATEIAAARYPPTISISRTLTTRRILRYILASPFVIIYATCRVVEYVSEAAKSVCEGFSITWNLLQSISIINWSCWIQRRKRKQRKKKKKTRSNQRSFLRVK
jgi:hypothetical protein